MKIRHDIHTHSLLSSCCYDPEATFENYFRRAKELGHTVFGISNHLWDEKVPGASHWYHMQMINYGLEGARNSIPDIPGMKILIGTETEYCGMSDTLGMLAETAKRFDYILVPHTHMHMKNFVIPEDEQIKEERARLLALLEERLPDLPPALVKKMASSLSYGDIEALLGENRADIVKFNADFMFDSFMKLMNNAEFRKIAASVPTSVAHSFHPCGYSREMSAKIIAAVSEDRLAECFTTARDLGVFIEINTGAFTHSDTDYEGEELIRVFRIALGCGCRFTFGTDTHSLKGLDDIRRADRISELIGITEDDLAPFVRG